MIPQIIHYCWFGTHPKPERIQGYIDGWKEKLPDYQFVEWNEENFTIDSSIPYVKEAYAAGKYAFVSDYVRLYALSVYGGIYMDTDVELMRDFSSLLLQADMILCYETKRLFCTAFMASAPQHPVMVGFRDSYNKRRFKLPDGTANMTTVNQYLTDYICTQGIQIGERLHREQGNIAIYPTDYFSGQDIDHGHPNITENTYTVHRLEGAWCDKATGLQRLKAILKYRLLRPGLHKLLGYKKADALIDLIKSK